MAWPGIDVYMEQWLKTATKGTVRFRKCEMCGVWTKDPLTGLSGHGTTCKALVTNPDQQVPTVVNHVPPPPRPSAPVNDVFEDKGRKFR